MGASVTGCAAAGPGRLGEAQPEKGVELDAVGCEATAALELDQRPGPRFHVPARPVRADHHHPGQGQVRDLVEKMPKAAGRRVDLSTPFVEANLLTSPMGA